MIPLGVVSNKANALYHHHNQSNGGTTNNLGEMTITELQEIALRQQQQIDINHQLLLAREKRLNILKLEEARNQQLTLLTNSLSSAALNSNSNSQFQVASNGKQNALSQELKIFKLKQLRSQLLDSKLSNSNMCSELDLIKTLFKDKEKDLTWAMNKVEELKRQIEQLGGLRASNRVGPTTNKVHQPHPHVSSSTSNITELERLKQELQIRNKLNEQQSKKIQQQQDLFNRKQLELIELDKRIDELKTRIRNKRHRLQSHHHNQLNHEALEREIAVKNMQMMNETAQPDSSYQQHAQTSKSSPSKVVAKFASKQEIANTYMNRTEAFQKYRMMQNNTPQFNQSPSNMMVFSPSHPTVEEIENSSTSSASMNNNPSNVVNNPGSSTSSLGSLSSPVPQNNKQAQGSSQDAANSSLNNDTTSAASTSITLPSHLKLEFDKMKYLPDVVKTIKKRHSISEIEGSGNTIPPFIVQKLLEKHKEFNQPQQQQQSASQLQQQASFNSLSSVSSNNSSTNTPLITSQNSSSSSIKLSKIPEASNEGVSNSPSIVKQQQQAQIIPIVTNSNNTLSNNNSANGNSTKLTTFLPSVKDSQVLPTIKENPTTTTVNEQQAASQIEIVTEPSLSVKSTKSIIKQTNNNNNATTESGENGEAIVTGDGASSSGRRVNFDPHALLLDAAVEGELDLVMKCARLVGNISEPNDEGITALHNSVCAGHFEIVKFLVEAGCDVNYADNDGWTPLHCAASCNNLQMLRFLIENGASVFATTLSDNETAARKCEEDEQGYQACFEYLKMIEKNVGDMSVNGGLVHTLYSYEREQDDELSFQCGDKLIVIDKHDQDPETEDGWWTCRLVTSQSDDASQENDEQGPVGLVPKNYLGLYPRIQPKLLISSQEESTIC